MDAPEALRDSNPDEEASEDLEVLRGSNPAAEASEVLEPQSDTHPVSEEPGVLRGSHPDPEDVVLEAVIRRDLVEYRRDSRESRMAGTVLALEVLAEVKARVCGNKRSPV